MRRSSPELPVFIRGVARSLLPLPIRRQMDAAWRKLVFRRAMRRFLRNPQDCTRRHSPTLARLIYGWNDPPWTASGEYLAGCVDCALNSCGPILECGSGLSTILVGAIAGRRGQGHWVLEHNLEWASKVQRYLDNYELDTVLVRPMPLKDYGEFCWYDTDVASLPDSFSLVLCDGPPYDTKGGRYGLTSIMAGRLKPGCIILLDDARRKQERAIARRWELELGASSEVKGCEEPYIKMMVAGGQNSSSTGMLRIP